MEKIGSHYYCNTELLGKHSNIEQLQSLERLERLERLESLERLERLERVTTFIGDYQEVKIKPDSLIYCDIPYKDTEQYSVDFDHERFYDWVEKQRELVVISEYSMPEDRFICIAEFEHRSTLCATNNRKRTVEKLFVPFRQLYNWEHLFKQMEFDFSI